MPKAWLLPEHTADVLPDQASDVESLRRSAIDAAAGYGYRPVMPPLVEHIESLLTGGGAELDLRTVKVVDQISGRTLGVRADMTPQAARIDAHLLNRQGPVRLCYCGPVLHARPRELGASRDPLQFGAELYGHTGLEADLEVVQLALDIVQLADVGPVGIDLNDVRVVSALVGSQPLRASVQADLVAALTAKDRAAVTAAASGLDADCASALRSLVDLYGPAREVLDAAVRCLPQQGPVVQALQDLQWLVGHLEALHPGLDIGVDLASIQGFGYYTGVGFALYAPGHGEALMRGGRYDDIGAVFGRRRPAVGFSVDLKAVAALRTPPAAPRAILAPWGESAALREAVRGLRAAGEQVVVLLPGQQAHLGEIAHDRRLVEVDGRWQVQAVDLAAQTA